MWTTLIFIITISILVTIHEFGHFIVARWCRVRVESFSVGFGKSIWSYVNAKGTRFSLSMIPLGGYVKMVDEKDVEENDKTDLFSYKPIYQRAAIISAGPIANFILAFLIYWIIFQIGVLAYPVKIGAVIPNTPAATVNIPQNAELKSIAGIKVESWSDVNIILISQLGKQSVELTYKTEESQKEIKKNVDIRHWHFDVENESSTRAFGLIQKPLEIYPVVDRVIKGSAAQEAGIKKEDKIISYNDIEYHNWADFVTEIRKGKVVNLKLQRGNDYLELLLTPKVETDSQGSKVGIAGFYPKNNTYTMQYDMVSAITKSWTQMSQTTGFIARSFYQLLTGVISLKNLSGPVSIAQGASQTASYGLVPYLYFLAFISISLGIVNLIPLPVLDGGHLIFLLIEKLKGSPLSKTAQGIFYRLGFILLMSMMAIALFNDFMRLL